MNIQEPMLWFLIKILGDCQKMLESIFKRLSKNRDFGGKNERQLATLKEYFKNILYKNIYENGNF